MTMFLHGLRSQTDFRFCFYTPFLGFGLGLCLQIQHMNKVISYEHFAIAKMKKMMKPREKFFIPPKNWECIQKIYIRKIAPFGIQIFQKLNEEVAYCHKQLKLRYFLCS